MSRRVFVAGCGLVLLGLALGMLATDTLNARYSGARIVIRPWLAAYSAVIAGATALALGVVGVAAWLRSRRTAAVLWGLGCLAAAAHAATPLWLGMGPFAPGAASVAVLTALVFLPGVLRAVGALAYSPRSVAILALAGVDLAVCVGWWIQTPVEVLARAHPAGAQGVWQLPAVATWVVLLIGSARRD